MRYDDWGDHGGGAWWMLVMMVLMAAFWIGLAWVVVTALRRPHGLVGGGGGGGTTDVTRPPATVRPTPRDILDERLARGEIEPDEYRRRLDALSSAESPPRG